MSTATFAQYHDIPETQWTAEHKFLVSLVDVSDVAPFPLRAWAKPVVVKGPGVVDVTVDYSAAKRHGLRDRTPSPWIGVHMVKCGDPLAARSQVRSSQSVSGPSKYVQIAELGDFSLRDHPNGVASRKAKSPDDWSDSVSFARGPYYVQINYRYVAPDGPLPQGKAWMDGDPDGVLLRVAKLIDSRLKLVHPSRKRGG